MGRSPGVGRRMQAGTTRCTQAAWPHLFAKYSKRCCSHPCWPGMEPQLPGGAEMQHTQRAVERSACVCRHKAQEQGARGRHATLYLISRRGGPRLARQQARDRGRAGEGRGRDVGVDGDARLAKAHARQCLRARSHRHWRAGTVARRPPCGARARASRPTCMAAPHGRSPST